MKPIRFPQQNVVFGEGQEEYEDLPAMVVPNDPTGAIHSCWKMTDKEFEIFKRTKTIWFHQLTFQQQMQPIGMDVTPPFVDPESHN